MNVEHHCPKYGYLLKTVCKRRSRKNISRPDEVGTYSADSKIVSRRAVTTTKEITHRHHSTLPLTKAHPVSGAAKANAEPPL